MGPFPVPNNAFWPLQLGATYQRLMELVLSGVDWRTCLVYIDDIIVFSKTFEDHLRTLKEVFQCLRQANLILKPPKCPFFRRSVTFLGHMVSEKGIVPDPSNVDKVQNYPTPRSVAEVRGFLGLASYYRKFIPDFAKRAEGMFICKNY